MKYLFCTDGSDDAEKAFAKLLHITKHDDLVYILSTYSLPNELLTHSWESEAKEGNFVACRYLDPQCIAIAFMLNVLKNFHFAESAFVRELNYRKENTLKIADSYKQRLLVCVILT